MSNTVVPNEVYRAVKDGPVEGVVTSIEPQPNGDNLVTLRKPSTRWNPQTKAWELKPENQAGARHDVPQELVSNMFSDLPTEVRRTARERYQELLRKLWADVNLHFYKDGQVRFPKSIQDEIAVLGLAQGKPNLNKQVEALARRFIVKGARQQQEQDSKRVVRDWHGHLSA